MTTLPDQVNQLCDALAAYLDMPELPTGLRESADNLRRALLKKYSPAPGAPSSSASPLFAPAEVRLSRLERQRIEEKCESLLKDIQYATEAGQDTAPLEKMLRDLTENDPQWEERLITARRKGENARREREHLEKLLQNDLLSEAVRRYWRELPQRAGWFKRKAEKQVRWIAGKQLQRLAARDGRRAAHWLAEAQRFYGDVLAGLELPQPAHLPVIPTGTEHRLTHMPPAQRWFIYIDESGQSFSTAEGGSEGHVVAVCTRDGERLPDLKLHCTEAPTARVLDAFATLLRQPCGILGLPQSSLNIQSREGWLQSVRELVKWVWRLLPLPDNGQPSQLLLYIEQRAQYSGEVKTGFGGNMFQAELTREAPDRAEKISIQQIEFVGKDDPLCAWADVAAYCWQSTQPEIRKAVKESGLIDACLLRPSASTLSICHDVMTGKNPDAAGWRHLVEAGLRPDLLVSRALDVLQRRCLADVSLWQPYVQAMQDYLLGKRYELPVLEGMAQWLSPMRSDDLVTNFFWLSARLAHLNHRGDAASDDLNEVKHRLLLLAPQMGTLDPVAELHVALRLAVSDANAFDFARAEARLAFWNPDAEGRLTGSALWDGKILSSLGQYRAFQRDLAGACRLFRQALEHFSHLPEDEARRQSSQTRTYLAIAAMDRPDIEDEEARRLVEAALDADIPSFAARMAGTDGMTDRYGHYLLTRYLSRRGTPEERAIYLAKRQRWTRWGSGFSAGHPWPIIQYHRWLMTDRDDADLRNALAGSLQQALGTEGLTVEVIVWAIALSMGVLHAHAENVSGHLHRLAAMLPDSEPIVRQLLAAESPDARLAQRVLPFNYC